MTRIGISTASVRDGENLIGHVGMIQDITERKEAAEALRESEQRFRSSFEDVATGMTLLTPDGRYLQVNRAMCEIVGYTEEELLEKTFQEITHPDDLEADLRLGRRVLEGEDRAFSMEKRYIRKDGSAVWVNLTVSMLRDTSGEPLYSIAQVQDITERKRAEEALRFLAEASGMLSSSLDYRETLASVARLAVPTLADWCAVDILEEDGSIVRLAVEHEDQEKGAPALELRNSYSPNPNRPHGVPRVLTARFTVDEP